MAIDERHSGTPITPIAALGAAMPGKRGVWFSILVAGAALAAVIVVAASLWNELGDSEITTAGWIALGIGITLTTVIGVALMALVFISSRRGWDEDV